MLLIHPPPPSPPLLETRSQLMAYLSAVAVFPYIGKGVSEDAPDFGDKAAEALIQAAEQHDAVHCLCRSEIGVESLTRLMSALRARRSRLHLSLSCSTQGAGEAAPGRPEDVGSITQIQWRVADRMPDVGFFRAFSRAGIWNHLVLDGGAATAVNIGAVVRQPNIVHSWEAAGTIDEADAVDDGYRRVTPLPGRPLWQTIGDPVQRFMLIDRFGRDWLLRSRVKDDHRLFAVGESLTYHFSPPDRLPAGYLDEICAMVAAGGTVATTHVRSNLERAFLIGYVLEDGVIVGNSSLKNPRTVYIDNVRRQSGLDLTGFVERGYTSVRPEYRGLGIGTRLLSGLTARAGDRKIFSVIAEDNHATKIIARRNRTRQVAAYYSEKAGKRVGIWMPERMIDDHEKRQT
jgi:GNAT superfamily N-acetyltransferase